MVHGGDDDDDDDDADADRRDFSLSRLSCQRSILMMSGAINVHSHHLRVLDPLKLAFAFPSGDLHRPGDAQGGLYCSVGGSPGGTWGSRVGGLRALWSVQGTRALPEDRTSTWRRGLEPLGRCEFQANSIASARDAHFHRDLRHAVALIRRRFAQTAFVDQPLCEATSWGRGLFVAVFDSTPIDLGLQGGIASCKPFIIAMQLLHSANFLTSTSPGRKHITAKGLWSTFNGEQLPEQAAILVLRGEPLGKKTWRSGFWAVFNTLQPTRSNRPTLKTRTTPVHE